MQLFGVILIIVTVFGEKINKSNKTLTWNPFEVDDFTIVKDFVAKPGDFPSAIRLYVYHKPGKPRPTLRTCTTAIITENLVVTAAECAAQTGIMHLVVGESDHNDFINGLTTENFVQYNVTSKFIHPEFSPFTRKHNVAVLGSDRPMSHKGFGILPVSFEPLKKTKEAIMYGWGDNSDVGNTLFGKKVLVKPCHSDYPDHESICPLGYGSGVEDKGSPLIIDGELRGICSSYTQEKINSGDKRYTTYKYTFDALWEEKDFLEKIISGTELNHSECFLYFTMMFVTFVL